MMMMIPGLSKATSIRSGRDVAATIKILLLVLAPIVASTPSMKVRSWFTTLSVTPVLSLPDDDDNDNDNDDDDDDDNDDDNNDTSLGSDGFKLVKKYQ